MRSAAGDALGNLVALNDDVFNRRFEVGEGRTQRAKHLPKSFGTPPNLDSCELEHAVISNEPLGRAVVAAIDKFLIEALDDAFAVVSHHVSSTKANTEPYRVPDDPPREAVVLPTHPGVALLLPIATFERPEPSVVTAALTRARRRPRLSPAQGRVEPEGH